MARTVWCPRWPQALDGFTILHISDFHLGELLTPDQALGMVADAQEQAGPVDLLAMTGDLIDFDDFSGARTLLARLAAYPARYGAWAVTGNHDVLVDPDAFSRLYDGVGIHLLDNQSHAVCPAGRPEITVSGIEWGKSRRRLSHLVRHVCGTRSNATSPGRRAEKQGLHDKDQPAHVLLSHHPDAFRSASRILVRKVDLVLSGHTHGGQINLRQSRPAHASRLPRSSFSLTRHRYQWGIFRRGHCRLHVTSGVGSWFPVRVKCPPEIALLTVRAGHRQS